MPSVHGEIERGTRTLRYESITNTDKREADWTGTLGTFGARVPAVHGELTGAHGTLGARAPSVHGEIKRGTRTLAPTQQLRSLILSTFYSSMNVSWGCSSRMLRLTGTLGTLGPRVPSGHPVISSLGRQCPGLAPP